MSYRQRLSVPPKIVAKDYLGSKQQDVSKFYHSTFDDFELFDFTKSPFGMHFGTEESAKNRIQVKKNEAANIGYPVKDDGESPKLFVVELDIKNSLILSENRMGGWTPFDVIRAVMEEAENSGLKGFTDKDIGDFYQDAISHNGLLLVDLIDEDYGNEYNSLDQKEHLFVRDWIESKGYDSIKYSNEFECGGDSIIVLRENQINIVEKKILNPRL
jgi:hypothetical protein